MKNPKRFYTYAYLRENGTPYYIGKGCARRIYVRNRRHIKPPEDKSRVIFLKKNLTEDEAFKHEIYMINIFGRKDLGTGILLNMSDGGQGSSGYKHTKKAINKISKTSKGRVLSEETKKKISDSHKGKKGHNLSEETKLKISLALKGRVPHNKGISPSLEVRNKISNSLKKKKKEIKENKINNSSK